MLFHVVIYLFLLVESTSCELPPGGIELWPGLNQSQSIGRDYGTFTPFQSDGMEALRYQGFKPCNHTWWAVLKSGKAKATVNKVRTF